METTPVNVRIETELYARFKDMCKAKDVKISDVIKELMQDALTRNLEKPRSRPAGTKPPPAGWPQKLDPSKGVVRTVEESYPGGGLRELKEPLTLDEEGELYEMKLFIEEQQAELAESKDAGTADPVASAERLIAEHWCTSAEPANSAPKDDSEGEIF
jgi:hypothetical protein